MISKCIKPVFLSAALLSLTVLVSSCSSSSGSSSAGVQVALTVSPVPVNTVAMPAGAKTFDNTEGDSITLTKAYMVIASATIESSCGASFSAAAENLLDIILPKAHAHTTATPTSTGIPYVIDLLANDGTAISLGSLSPPPADYCGVDIDMFAADDDTKNLPTGAGEPDMDGRTVYIEGSYTLNDGITSGNILIDTSATLINRYLLLSALMSLSGSNLNGAVDMKINYDAWFDGISLSTLESETATSTNPSDTQVNQLLQNITASIHQR